MKPLPLKPMPSRLFVICRFKILQENIGSGEWGIGKGVGRNDLLDSPFPTPRYRFSHIFILRGTRSDASCWTKCPAFGIVTSVRSLSSHSQVLLSAPGS